MNYTYILQCADHSYYTGWTNDLEKRLAAHNAGTASKYTRSRRPIKLVYSCQSETKEDAMRKEWKIKQLTRKQKTALIEGAAVLEDFPTKKRRKKSAEKGVQNQESLSSV